MKQAIITTLLNCEETIAAALFTDKTYPWEVLPQIGDWIRRIGPNLPSDEYEEIEDGVWAAKDVTIWPTVSLKGPCLIDHEAELRQSAFVRGQVVIGRKSVVGNSTEVKNSILFNCVEAPHYNYIGDSILGFHAHMGAGSITSNIKSDRTNIVIKGEDEEIETGMRKIGAILGDWCEIGCGSVLNPGSIVGRGSIVYPLSSVRGLIPAQSIYKAADQICPREE